MERYSSKAFSMFHSKRDSPKFAFHQFMNLLSVTFTNKTSVAKGIIETRTTLTGKGKDRIRKKLRKNSIVRKAGTMMAQKSPRRFPETPLQES